MRRNKFIPILVLMICVFSCFGFITQKPANNDFSAHAKIVLREVGNQLLLANKDSVSLILPIKELGDFTYRISFEKALSFEPNTLVEIIKNVFKKTDFSKNYRVEVLDSETKEVAYSYQIKTTKEQTIVPCAGRFLPEKKYFIHVEFLDQVTKKFDYTILYYIFIPLILGILYRKFFLNKKEEEIAIDTDKNATTLGSFQFYPEQHKLVKKATEIALSKKECELLEIFVANPNTIIKREELTKRVWEDNGVFVGRSLDTYISKLRKKLQEDANIQLVNIHGVGYKLEIK